MGALTSCGPSKADEPVGSAVLPPDTSVRAPAHLAYSWTKAYDGSQSLHSRIGVPAGFKRVLVKQGSFGEWLRFLPLLKGKPDVHLYNGKLKGNQDAHAAIVDIDPGKTDLQQCADAVMRMRAEYLYSVKRYDDIHFRFTSGDDAPYTKWTDGYRPVIKGNKVSWVKKAGKDESYTCFRQYLDIVFTYAGTLSLSKELKKVSVDEMQPGDVFILGGSPGHAVLVVDMAENDRTGEKLFLIQQSYMPAQEIHLLRNPGDAALSPWYKTKFTGDLETPEWTFSKDQLMRFTELTRP